MNFLEFYVDGKRQGKYSTTDKNEYGHTYISDYYNNKFTSLRDEPIKLLEIGNFRGDGLKLFREWFINADIYGIEANPIIFDVEKSDNVYVVLDSKYDDLFTAGMSTTYVPECICYMMDAYANDALNKFEDESLDIIIDDGSHSLDHQLYVLTHWIKKLKSGGTLIIEDIQDITHCAKFKEVLKDTATTSVYDMRILNETTPDNIIFEVIKTPITKFDEFFQYNYTTEELLVNIPEAINTPQLIDETKIVEISPKKKILVAQYYTENIKCAPYSTALNKKYCNIHGYDYLAETDTDALRTFAQKEDIALQWYKVVFLMKLMEEQPEYEWFLFMDADAIFTNISERIEAFCDDTVDVVISDSRVHHCVTNTGVILIKNTQWSREFLIKWWEARNTTNGKDVMDLLDWSGGMHVPENNSVFRSSLWHEQTVLSFLYKKDSTLASHIKFIKEDIFNSHVYNPKGFIFHAYGYGWELNRSIDTIHEARTSEFQRTSRITVVYFIYCISDYLNRARNDFERIKNSGLYNDLYDLHVVASLPDIASEVEYIELSKIFMEYDKIQVHKVYNNKYEHYGIVRAWLEAHKSDGPILYFHAKGISAIYTDSTSHTKWKRDGDASFIEMLKYFMIDNYKNCLYKLEVYDQVNVSDSYSRGWPSGNFWWANKSYLRENPFPWESTYDRWASEAWINFRRVEYSVFQFYDRFGVRDKFTFIPEMSYKNPELLVNKKITLLSAKFMTLMEPENENDMNRPSQTNEVDVTDFIQANLNATNNKGFTEIIVSNVTLGNPFEDPCPGVKKSLVIEFTISNDDTVYRIVGDEGQRIDYKLDKYSSVGYMFHRNKKITLENILTTNINDTVRFE